MESPFTTREQHPTGIAGVTASTLVPLITWIATLFGVSIDVAVATSIAGLIIAAAVAVSSKRNPRITIPDLPTEPVDDRGITPATPQGDQAATSETPPPAGQ